VAYVKREQIAESKILLQCLGKEEEVDLVVSQRYILPYLF